MHYKQGPIVKREFGNIVRNARGYSLPELRKAGIDPGWVRGTLIRFDRLRRSAHDENVEQLKSIYKTIIESHSMKPKPSKATTEGHKSRTKKSKSK